MKRIIFLIISVLLVFSNTIQAQSFSSKEEAMDYSKGLHNGAIIHLQKYLNSRTKEELITAVKGTFAASEIATKNVTNLADVMSYGSDAVKIVKICNNLMAFFMHEIAHENISNANTQIDPEDILNHYYANLMWMMQMIELNKTM
jgi:glycerol-3-phosphate dehydrogenase